MAACSYELRQRRSLGFVDELPSASLLGGENIDVLGLISPCARRNGLFEVDGPSDRLRVGDDFPIEPTGRMPDVRGTDIGDGVNRGFHFEWSLSSCSYSC